MNTVEDINLSSFLKLVKIGISFPIGCLFTLAGIVEITKTISIFFKFLSAGFVAWAYIMSRLFLGFMAIGVSLFAWRRIFSKKLGFLSYSKIALINFVIAFACAIFSMIDSFIVDEFQNARYPSYIESWPIKTAYSEKDCDYSRDKIYLQGNFSFIKNDFRPDVNVKVVYDDSLTNKYRVEINYKGDPSKVYIRHNDYDSDNEQYGKYIDNVDIWTIDYNWDMSDEDIIHMYKYKQDLRYAHHLVIEKIIIRTAYPDKIDVSQMTAFNY